MGKTLRGKHLAPFACGAAAIVLLAASALGQDGNAAYAARRDTMKQLGRAFYLGIGRVVKGRAVYGPDTVVAAESLPPLVAKIGTLFPAGSDVAGSSMKPEILAAPEKVAQMTAAVQAATPPLIAAVKSGDMTQIAATYATMGKACDACHNDYRKEE